MLPTTENLDDLTLDFEDSEQENTQTFGINMEENTIGGIIDDLEAVRQSVYLMLSTEADQYIIYPYTYGINTVDLFGKPSYYVVAVLPDRIRETLMNDDRITDVSEFDFEVNKNEINVSFVVSTIYGKVKEEMVVTY